MLVKFIGHTGGALTHGKTYTYSEGLLDTDGEPIVMSFNPTDIESLFVEVTETPEPKEELKEEVFQGSVIIVSEGGLFPITNKINDTTIEISADVGEVLSLPHGKDEAGMVEDVFRSVQQMIDEGDDIRIESWTINGREVSRDDIDYAFLLIKQE